MLVVDANVLLNAVNRSARDHEAASRWLGRALGGGESVGFAWAVVLAFLRISTHRAVLPRPLALGEAAHVLDVWLGARPAVLVEPTPRHLPVLRGLLERAGTAANLVNDAHLAALALEHGATVVSFDRDFGRFEGLSTLVPA